MYEVVKFILVKELFFVKMLSFKSSYLSVPPIFLLLSK